MFSQRCQTQPLEACSYRPEAAIRKREQIGKYRGISSQCRAYSRSAHC